MNLLFVTGCLEPGRDGVGDYSVRLASECNRLGHTCFLLALNDSFVSQSISKEQNGLSFLRLSSSLSRKEKTTLAKQFVESSSPDWVSLQFVSYAFHARGINWYLPQLIQDIQPKRSRLHIMFHELWIGEAMNDSLTKRLTGFLQKYFILKLVQKCKPNSVTTSLPVFKKMLSLNGVNASLLPLFSNIPVAQNPEQDWIISFFNKSGIDASPFKRRELFVVVLFGSLHNDWPHEAVMQALKQACSVANKKIVIASVGRMGTPNSKWATLQSEYGADVSFLEFGEHSQKNVSSLLSWADAGISPIPMMVLGKSGTYAAMKDHGLPVFCNEAATPLRFRYETEADEYANLILVKNQGQETPNILNFAKIPQADSLQNTLRLFLDYLK